MNNIFQTFSSLFSNSYSAMAAILSLALLGILSIIGVFSKANRLKVDEADKADDRLIGLLQGTVDQLEKKISTQTVSLNDAMKRLITLEAENEIMKKVFQGRDENMQTFMKQGFDAISKVPLIMKQLQKNNDNIEKLYELLATRLQVVEATTIKRMPVIGQNNQDVI